MPGIWRGGRRGSAAGDYYLRDGERVEAPGRWVLGRVGAGAIGVEGAGGLRAAATRELPGSRQTTTKLFARTVKRANGSGDMVPDSSAVGD
jgi:hypothetical protein